jgi:hypothetical protein
MSKKRKFLSTGLIAVMSFGTFSCSKKPSPTEKAPVVPVTVPFEKATEISDPYITENEKVKEDAEVTGSKEKTGTSVSVPFSEVPNAFNMYMTEIEKERRKQMEEIHKRQQNSK